MLSWWIPKLVIAYVNNRIVNFNYSFIEFNRLFWERKHIDSQYSIFQIYSSLNLAENETKNYFILKLNDISRWICKN